VYDAVFGAKGEPVLRPEGYSTLRLSFDARGDQIESSYSGTDDHLIAPPQIGFAKVIAKYSPRGQTIEEVYYGPDDRLAIRPGLGAARFTWSYDAHGRLVEEGFYGLDRKAPVAYGYSKVALSYDSDGMLVRKTFFDGEGKEAPALVAIGNVSPGGQAMGLGLAPGDVIESYDGRAIRYAYWLQNLVKSEVPGPHEIVIARNGRAATLQVKPGPLGIDLKEMTPQAAAMLSAATAAARTGLPPPR
jgi:S1-C subfamily serine protease